MMGQYITLLIYTSGNYFVYGTRAAPMVGLIYARYVPFLGADREGSPVPCYIYFCVLCDTELFDNF